MTGYNAYYNNASGLMMKMVYDMYKGCDIRPVL